MSTPPGIQVARLRVAGRFFAGLPLGAGAGRLFAGFNLRAMRFFAALDAASLTSALPDTQAPGLIAAGHDPSDFPARGSTR